MRMATVYMIDFGKRGVYVGVTTGSIKNRLSSHKYQIENGRSYSLSGIKNFSSAKVTKLESVPILYRFEAEKKWIKKLRRKKSLLNLTDGGAGPNGVKLSKKRILQVSGQMRARWENDREGMLKRVNSHKTKESQRAAGKLGAIAKWSKAIPFKFYDGKKLVGKFKSKRELSMHLGVCESTAGRRVNGSYGKSRYRVEWIGG